MSKRSRSFQPPEVGRTLVSTVGRLVGLGPNRTLGNSCWLRGAKIATKRQRENRRKTQIRGTCKRPGHALGRLTWLAGWAGPVLGSQTCRRIFCHGSWSWCSCRNSIAELGWACRSSCWVCSYVRPIFVPLRQDPRAWIRRWRPPKRCKSSFWDLTRAQEGTATTVSVHCLYLRAHHGFQHWHYRMNLEGTGSRVLTLVWMAQHRLSCAIIWELKTVTPMSRFYPKNLETKEKYTMRIGHDTRFSM